MAIPDSTAVTTALWRAAHVRLDEAPYVLEDTVGLQLVNEPAILENAGFAGGDGWQTDPRITRSRLWRGSIVARARCVEDLVVERLAAGVKQYVSLGAGLDTFALRHPDLGTSLVVYEVDEPATQRWKQARIEALGIAVPSHLRFVPMNFESGGSWVDALQTHGYDLTQPAVVASTGVSQYLTEEATIATMRSVARLALGSTLACTFQLPIDMISDPIERAMRTATEAGSKSLGHPWVSFYAPEAFLQLARDSGFGRVEHISADDWIRSYFAGRRDGLLPAQSDQMLLATVTPTR